MAQRGGVAEVRHLTELLSHHAEHRQVRQRRRAACPHEHLRNREPDRCAISPSTVSGHGNAERDRVSTALALEQGWHGIRVWESEVSRDADAVARRILVERPLTTR